MKLSYIFTALLVVIVLATLSFLFVRSLGNEPSRITFTQYDSTQTGYKAGDTIRTYIDDAGKPHIVASYNVRAVDTIYTLEASDAIKRKHEAARGDYWFTGLGLAIIIASLVILVVGQKEWSAWLLMAAILGGGAIAFGSIDWIKSNSAQTISKPIYDSIINTDGTIDKYLDTHIH